MFFIAQAPENLIAAINNTKATQTTISRDTAFLGNGSRNNDFASIAGFLHRKGHSCEEVYSLISSMNAALTDPLPDYEVENIARSISKYKITPEDFTHSSFAKLLIHEFGDNVKYIKNHGFSVFNGKLWNFDIEELVVTHTALLLADEISTDIENMRHTLDPKEFSRLKHAVNKLKNAGFIRNALDLVKSHPSIHADYSIFEKNPQLLNFSNGTFDLDAMVFRDFDCNDHLNITLDIAYDPKADCPRFKQFLRELFDEDVASFVVRVLGYSLLGSPTEQKMFILYGHGRNGKSVLVDVIGHLLSSYCCTIQPESLTGKLDGTIRNDLIKLIGTRIMFTSETRAGTILDSALIKQITGQDKISARKLYKEFIEFTPQCVPFLVTNHLPVIDGADFAMTRRMCLIPFDHTVANPDRNLPSILKGEVAGIFNLLLEGICQYRVEGLNVPSSVAERTITYLNSSNLMKSFFKDCLENVQGEKVYASRMYFAYRAWASNNGYKPLSSGIFKEMFERELGFVQRRSDQGLFWPNLKLQPNR